MVMLTKLLTILMTVVFVGAAGEFSKGNTVILSASSESQIKAWASDKGTSSRVLKFNGGGKEVIVLLVDTASGLTRENIYVYFLEGSEWHLCLLRLTNGKVEVEKTDKSLVFKNPKGTVLVVQPFDSTHHAATEGLSRP